MRSSYEYEDFAPVGTARLLYLEPGRPDDSLKCSLLTADMNALPEYEALSYTWGPPEPTLPVSISDKLFYVRSNLDAALRVLRQDRARLLWIDAICINQGSEEEKKQQIAQMREIYTGASRVVVWLGPDENAPHGAHVALEFCSTLQTLQNEDRSRSNRDPVSKTQVNGERIFGSCDSQWKACELLFERPWWSRAWVIQECIHRNEVLVYIGHFTTSIDKLCDAFNAYKNSMRARVSLASDPDDREDYTRWLSCEKPDVPDCIRRYRREAAYPGSENLPGRIAFITYQFREMQASEPRDKIYAFRGMAQNRQDIPTDWYTLPTVQLFTRVMQLYIQKVLVPLLWVESPKRKNEFDGLRLPSWVPDFTSEQTLRAKGLCSGSGWFRSDAGFPPVNVEPRLDWQDWQVLILRGIAVGVITNIYDTHLSNVPDVRDGSSVRLFTYTCTQLNPYESTDAWDHRQPIPESKAQLIRFDNTSWGPHNARPGDLIIVTPGSNLPIVLRPLNTSISSSVGVG